MEDKATTIRNERVYALLTNSLKSAEPDQHFHLPFLAEEVELLFTTSVWGHRELVLTILLTRLIYPDYKATEDLYQHNPRSVYEKPIRRALREYGIPHKKSGPLNVAKNIKRLNIDWATGKHGENTALAAVRIVEKIEKVSKDQLKKFADAYISRYKLEATRIREMDVVLPPQENPIYIANLCTDLVNNVPDGGATAQYIVGLLMETNNTARGSSVIVSGYADSVSATNTTSKKPGDIIETTKDNKEIVYEVTTKAFTDDRLIESHESVRAYSDDIADVIVICRPPDVPPALEASPSTFLMASTQYEQLSYYFVNIYEYIQILLLLTTTDARKNFYEGLTTYVNDINRAEKVKIYFKEWHKSRS